MQKYLIILPLLFLYNSLFSQDEADIKVIARIANNQVYLRWAPSTPIGWQLGNKYGYRVERYILSKDSTDINYNENNYQLLEEALKPIPKQRFEPLMDNKYNAIAAQAIYGESFDLSEDNTGFLSIINQVEENENRFSFALLAADQHWETAEAIGLGLIDANIDTSLVYFYRVYLADTIEDYSVSMGATLVNYEEQKPLPKISEIEAEFGDQSVMLSWRSFYLQNFYTSYQIERSLDGRNFKSINQSNFLNLQNQALDIMDKFIFNDSIANDIEVFYRVRGISPFGIKGPYSDTISGKGNVKLKGIAAVITKQNITATGINLEWKFPDDHLDKVKGFKVARSNTANGPFAEFSMEMLSPISSSFKDENPLANNYYVINTYYNDTSFLASIPEYIPLYDSIAPEPPTGLQGSIDTSGIVKIYWNQNYEQDLQGYHIYKVNDLKEEWYRINNQMIRMNFFVDSIAINNLTKDIYYAIIALDHHYNPSDYSKPIKLKKPDVIPPPTPVLLNYLPTDSSLFIAWQQIKSEDLMLYKAKVILEDSILENEIEILRDRSQFSYQFKSAGNYSLQIIALDSSANYSSPLSISARSLVLTKNVEIQYQINRDLNAIEFTWKGDDLMVDIYKKTKGSQKRLLKSQVTKVYIDRDINPNNTYFYSFNIWQKDSFLDSKNINIAY